MKSRGVNYKKVSGNKGERTECGNCGGVKSWVKSVVKSVVKSSVESSVESSEKKLSSAEKIVAYLRTTPTASAHELSIVVNLTVRAVEKNLRALRESGRLRRVGPDKGGHWEVVV